MTQHTQEGPRLIGGEMLNWSDLDGTHGPGPVRGAALAPFLAAARGRTLIAGPHDPALLDAVPGATLLVRSIADAGTLSRRAGTTVLCGSPAKLSAEAPFDTVIALAGLECLGTAEDDDLSWAETLDALRESLAPGGTLILGLQNLTGIHHHLTVPQPPADAAWTPLPDESRPAGLIQARAVLGQATRAYAVYPGLWNPAVILDEHARGGVTEAALLRAFPRQGTVVADPGTVAVELLRQGLGVLAAPAWIIVAAREDVQLPAVVCGPPREPEGPTLESVIVRAAGRRELPEVRRLLAGWQTSAAAGLSAGQVILTEDGGFVPLVPPVAPVEALRELAGRLLRGGFPHPWPNVRSDEELAALLAAMAGVDGEVPAPAVATGEVAASEAGDGRAGGEGERPVVLTEVLAERDRLRVELAEARAQASFFESEYDVVEGEVRQLRRTVELLSGSGPARAGQVFVGGVRAARRVLRRRT